MTKHLSLADVCGESLGYQSPSPLLPCDEHCYVAASHHSPANTQVERVWLCGNPLHCKEAGVWRQRCVYNHSTQKKKKRYERGQPSIPFSNQLNPHESHGCAGACGIVSLLRLHLSLAWG